MITMRNSVRGTRFPDTSGMLKLPLREYAPNSIITEVWLTPECIGAISEWAGLSLLRAGKKSIDEVGGFILGRFREDGGSGYRITFERFCPAFEVEYQSSSALVLGSGANQQLEQALDECPEYCLIGWFHTHPGHTPYLSRTDLDCTHELFYKKPYQVAVVLDSLTADFDTGIFTRSPEGKMLNKSDFVKWISWKKLQH